MTVPKERSAAIGEGTARFQLAPPRRFIFPAILLLLSERPGYGYGLTRRLGELHVGHIDRPAVYRALAQLMADDLVEAAPQQPRAGQERREYRVTPLGEEVLRVWMGVIQQEHESLSQVLRRYRATGTSDALIAEIAGGWSSKLGADGVPRRDSAERLRRLVPSVDAEPSPSAGDALIPPRSTIADAPIEPPARRRYRLMPDRSVVLVEARSTVGPISFGALGVTGWIDAAFDAAGLNLECAPGAHLELEVDKMRSGNRVYDAELLRRVDARRFPVATIDLARCAPPGTGNTCHVGGTVTFHGVTRAAEGMVALDASRGRRLVVTGEQVFDLRDFSIPSPAVLMVRIYPDIRVRLHAEADLEEAS